MNRFKTCLKNEWPFFVVVAYLFFSHVPRTAAMVNSLIGVMLLTTLYGMVKRKITLPWRSPIVATFTAFVSSLVLASVLSPYWQESLAPLRREVLPMTLCFVLLVGWNTTRLTNVQRIFGIAGAIVAAYVARTFLAFADLARQGLSHNVYTIDKSQAAFFDYFAVDSTLAFPILLSVILYARLTHWFKALLVAVALLALALVGVSEVRTAVACLVLVSLVQLSPWIWRHKGKSTLAFLLLCLTVYLALGSRIEQVAPRYASILSADTYKKDGAVVERYVIWGSVLEMVSERPVLGYGLGWQKMYDIAINQGYMDKWAQSQDELDQWAVRYFKVGRGAANPHNLTMQILFEAGALGLATYLALLLATVLTAWRVWCRAHNDRVVQWFTATLLCYGVAYFLINLTNGIWLTSGPTLMLICVAELLRQQYVQRAQGVASASV